VRKEDLELSREDIQLLSSSDALAAFFSKLCYETKESQHRIFMNSRLNGFLAKLGQPACISLGEITDACRRSGYCRIKRAAKELRC
jgi:hypothetical protein